MSLWRPPPFLAIVLKRFFVTERGRRRKLSERVAFPVDGLRLTDFLECGETEAADSPRNRKAAEAKGGELHAGGDDVAAPPVYDLVAVVNHFGGLEHGHYTCAARRLDGEGWFEFDDRRVEKLDMGAVCDDPAAYALRERNQIKEAMSVAETGLEFVPEEAVLWFNFACYSSLLGEVEDASQRLDEAVRLDKAFEAEAVDDADLDNLWQWIRRKENA